MNKRNKKSARPDIACWRIVSKCNRRCTFCYGPEVPELGTQQVKKVIDRLSDMNIKVLGITGGEPLIRGDIIEIFKYAKSKGLAVCLSTNADFFKQYQAEILEYVDVVGLPIEGNKPEIHDKIRGRGNFKAIMSATGAIYNHKKSRPLLRFTTVVTPNNYRDLLNIEKTLVPYKKKIIYWKLYEFIHYQDRKKQTMQKFDAAKYKSYIDELGRFLGHDKVCFDSYEERSRAYFLLNPNGDAIIPIEKEGKTTDLVIGNILADSQKKIISRWRQEIDLVKYTKPIRCVFRFKKSPGIWIK